MPTPSPAVVCSGLTFAWPDGTAVFTDFSLATIVSCWSWSTRSAT